jgi:hypothetical protein
MYAITRNAITRGRITGALTLMGLAFAPIATYAQAAQVFPVEESADPTVETTTNPVPAGALTGTLVLLDSGSAKSPLDQQNYNNWGDVVFFNGNAAALLYSDPDNGPTGQYFKDLQATGAFQAPTAFINESLTGPTPYDPHAFDPTAAAYDPNGGVVTVGPGELGKTTYKIYSDPANDPVPEASTTVSFGVLMLLGLGGVVLAARKKTA